MIGAEDMNNADKIAIITAENVRLSQALLEALARITWFEEQFKLFKQRTFGKQSETSNSLQLSLPLFDADENDEVAVAEELSADETTVTYTRKKKSNNGRNIDIANLPRERVEHDLTREEKICACGCELEKIGEDVSVQLDYIPASIKAIEHVKFKYACKACNTIKSAPKPEQPLAKSMAAASLITEVIIKKYDHHLPLYRQSKILKQEGIDIPDNTLGNWVMGAAELLSPLGDALWSLLPTVEYLQADETTVKILSHDKKGYLWGYHSCDADNRFIMFEFNLSRGSHVVDARLQGYKGALQTDGYSGYNTLRNNDNTITPGCWDHARRKFTDVVKICGKNKTGQAGKMLDLIGKLYAVEREVEFADNDERYKIRQRDAKPVLDDILRLSCTANAPPKSALGKALTYLNNQWKYLIIYIDHGFLNISNCLMENQIRPFALGRKNWLFVGNEISANRAALLYSLIQTCKLNNVNPRKYINYVLTKVHALRRKDIDPVSILPQFIDKKLLDSS